MAQQHGAGFLKKSPLVDLVVGTHALMRLPDLAEDFRRTGRRRAVTDFDYGRIPPPEMFDSEQRLQSFLTIMQGCDNYCAYCVVPYLRGREVSRPPEDVLAEAADLVAHGVREITLLGQNVNSYGRGLPEEIDFTDLAVKTAAIPGLLRLRFTTSHPKDFSPRLMKALAEAGPLCEHVHLPVQSGSTAVLRRMGRRYTRDEYLSKVEALRKFCPGAALTTDVIVGFPGESEDDFRRTMSLVEEVRFDGMYSFKYSDRPMTKASRLPDKIEDEVKGRRLAELQARQKEITIEINESLIGRRLEVLVENADARYPGQLSGRTRTNKIVNFSGPESLIGRTAEPVITDAWANSLRGRLD
jgi:tRNA-2-methylthio-N6-dimethylallyladenosine synthase